MQCTIYALGEKKWRTSLDRVLVLARKGEELILHRDELNALWELPEKALVRGESKEETARAALGEALGEAVFDVSLLCVYTITGEDGKESGGYCCMADVREWQDEEASKSRAFERLPLASQIKNPALVFALHKWAGEFFDERLEIERLGQPAPY